jgi:GTP cyclohydrolase II/3,4-dihydroxy 2-butanone 4-phosphate synthase/GTP cyclohydrolase II
MAIEMNQHQITQNITRYAETMLPTEHGKLRTIVYRDAEGFEHLALVVGDVRGDDVLCRVHSECLTGEVLGSLKCDCRQQLDAALAEVARSGRGVVLYLRQEGRGIGLGDKIRAYAMQERGLDTLDANRALGLPDDARDYSCAAAMLADLGIRSVALMTNNPLKVDGLIQAGIRVSTRVPHQVDTGCMARRYVAAKGARMGHLVTPATSATTTTSASK